MAQTPKADVAQKQQQAEHTPSRAWQACQPCRRRKVKCDGKQPCHNCSSRGHECEFPEAKDHASASRYYATSFEARCQQMDLMCQKLETITTQISRATEALNRAHPSLLGDGSLDQDLARTIAARQSSTKSEARDLGRAGIQSPVTLGTIVAAAQNSDQELPGPSAQDDDAYSDSNDSNESQASDDKLTDQDQATSDGDGAADQAASLVTDSYGRLRFVGGAANKMLIDAAKSMSPGARTHQGQTPGSSSLTETGDLQHAPTPQEDGDVELPLFVRGKTWPELPFLPKPEQLSRPPQYVSDLLVGLYFDKLHYTFPVLFKPHFMRSYAKMLRSGPNPPSSVVDKEFLMVFFAVCACASGLLPTGADRGFPGLEYYEKALLLHYASPGQASIENVQCLGLLAMCAASWNTLTQSWNLAGQAVRSSMDIGFHINSKWMTPGASRGGSMHPMEKLRHHIARRTWWSVFCLERIVSICLGRPMAVDEKDCCCELPLDLSDEDLERHCQPDQPGDSRSIRLPPEKRSLTGFLAFVRLCRISSKIQQLSSPLRLRQLSSCNTETAKKYLSRVASLDRALREWLETLPDSVRFSANVIEQRAGGESGLVMCVIVFIVHAGSLLNLYKCLAHDPKQTNAIRSHVEFEEATAQCISAARSCINAAELVRDIVPPSHYLAICVHCLTLSGVALLRMSKQPPDHRTIADAQMCVGFLKDLELRWSGAGRSRAIIEHLIADSSKQTTRELLHTGGTSETAQGQWSTSLKRSFAEFDDGIGANLEDTLWRDVPWTDVLEGNDAALFGSWGTMS